MTPPRPKVSVCVATYNHAPYIGQALDGILMQEVDFPLEIIVADDASTDGTRQIVEDYARRNPGVFRLLLRDTNGFARNQNFYDLMRAPSGEYAAFLDGDDFWTSPRKLQIQATFLDENRDFAMCFHNVNRIVDGKAAGPLSWPSLPSCPALEDLFEHNFITASAVMFRRDLLGEFPPWYLDLVARVTVGDWPMHVLIAQHGKMRYFDEVWGSYREHSRGAWNSRALSHRAEKTITILETLNRVYDYRFDRRVRRRVVASHFALARTYAEEGRHREAIGSLRNGARAIRTARQWLDRISLAILGARAMAPAGLLGHARNLRMRVVGLQRWLSRTSQQGVAS